MFDDDIPEGWEVLSQGSSPSPRAASPLDAFDLDGAAGFGKRFGTVTSTYRTPEHNRRVGGAPNSYHTRSRAVDIARARGVRHADIEAEYRRAGYELLESLDEGDHSHFAFKAGPVRSAEADVPEGWEVVDDDPGKPQGVVAAGFAGLPASEPEPQERTLDDVAVQPGYRSQVDPAKNAQLQTAFDRDASLDQLTKMAADLGIEFEHGNTGPLRGAIAWREKNGKGARIVPEAEEGPPPRLPGHELKALTTPEEPFGGTIPQRLGNIAYNVGEALGLPYAGRMQREAETIAEWAPVIGGASAIEQAGTDLQQGRYGSAAINASLGSLDFVPAIGPAGRMVGQPGKGIVGNAVDAAGRSGLVTSVNRGDGPQVARVFSPEGLEARLSGQRIVDRIDAVPEGWEVVANIADDPVLGRTRRMGEQPSPEDIAAAARSVRPEDVVPIPANAVERLDEFDRANPGTFRELAPPVVGRRPKRPESVVDHLKGWVGTQSSAKGMPVRIDAEDAINNGVPAEYIYSNPNVADKSKLRLRNPSIFGTRYGSMSGTQQQLRSLDQLDLDPVAWGYDEAVSAGRLEPQQVGDLLRRGFDGDGSAINRADPNYGAWSDYQARSEQRAEFEGRFPDDPPVEDVGQPFGLDDLRANDPPATAYEDLPRVGGKVGNINLAHVETRNDIRRLLQNVESKFGGFDAARRGRMSQGETAALASELGMTPDDLLKRRKGQALNAEQALAARQLLAKSSDEVTNLAKRMGEGPSDEERATFAKAIVRHAAIHEQVSGATAEAGRALAQFKMAAKSKAVSGRIHETIVQGVGGPDNLDRVAARILKLQEEGADPGEINKYAAGALKPRWSDYGVEYYYNALLSGVSTHVVNTASNLATQLTQIPEHLIAAGIGAVRVGTAKIAQQKAAERVLFSEVGARALGMVQGTKEGLHAFAKVMRTGDPLDPMTKVEARRHKVIPGVAGSVIRTPTRLLMAEDEFFKAMARRSSLTGLAVRQARKEGLSGEAAKNRIGELVKSPTDDMLAKSFDYARYMTFQTPMGTLGQMGSRWLEAAPVFKLVVPFLRTPVNLFKYAIERVPGAQLALKRVRDDYRAGGDRRDLAIARATFGAGIGATVMTYAAEGKITGKGPSDPSTRRLLMAGGWQPYSIKIGDTYYSYSRTDPFASLFGVAADLATNSKHLTEKQREKEYVVLFDSIMSQIESKTWLSGLSDLVKAIDEPARFADAYASRLVGSLIPTVSAHAAGSLDPIARQTTVSGDLGASIRNRVMSRIPGLSDNLEPQRDVWGQEIRDEGSPAQNFLSPFYMRTDKKDPVASALMDAGVGMGRPSRELSDGMGGQRRLTDQEFGQYQELAGRYIREDVQAAIADPEWAQLTPAEQKREIRAIVREARADARVDLLGNPEDWESGERAAGMPPGWEAVPAGWEVVSQR